jgi:hypothetical protein
MPSTEQPSTPPETPSAIDAAERGRRSWAAIEADAQAVQARAERSWADYQAASEATAEQARATGAAIEAENTTAAERARPVEG